MLNHGDQKQEGAPMSLTEVTAEKTQSAASEGWTALSCGEFCYFW